MTSFICPFCQHAIAISKDTLHVFKVTADDAYRTNLDSHVDIGHKSRFKCDNFDLQITYIFCPHCEQVTISLLGLDDIFEGRLFNIRPISLAKQFPDYIPEQIRNDYQEACAIVSLSPKASATLSRRCLQGMIRDFWKISKNTLHQEILALEGVLRPPQWKVIDKLRQLGNIGAHMEKDINMIVDIDEGEADRLIKLIEHLFDDWYFRRHEQEKLYTDIIDTAESKKPLKKME